MWSTRHFFNLQSGVIAYTNNYGRNGHILQYKMFGKYCHWTFCTVFKDKLIFVRYMKQSLTLVFGTVFIGWNQLQIFDNDNFSIIPKSIFSDNDNLPISCKNADLSAVDNFFDNIAHPYLWLASTSAGWSESSSRAAWPLARTSRRSSWCSPAEGGIWMYELLATQYLEMCDPSRHEQKHKAQPTFPPPWRPPWPPW